jgi:hypothetical protein
LRLAAGADHDVRDAAVCAFRSTMNQRISSFIAIVGHLSAEISSPKRWSV